LKENGAGKNQKSGIKDLRPFDSTTANRRGGKTQPRAQKSTPNHRYNRTSKVPSAAEEE